MTSGASSKCVSGYRSLLRLILRREQASTLAVMRILVGLVASYSLVSTWPVFDVVWQPRTAGGVLSLSRGSLLIAALGEEAATLVPALICLALLGALATLLGLGGWVVILLTQQLYLQLRLLNPSASGGYDTMIVIALFLLALGGCTKTLSLDCRLRRGSWQSRERVAAWPRYLIILQLVVLYTATGFQKVGLSWTPFGGYAALHYILNDPTWIRFSPEFTGLVSPLLRLGTAVSWHWEQATCLLPLVLYYRATRRQPGRLRAWSNYFDLRLLWVSVGIGMHLGILLLLNVGPFSWISLAYYVALFEPNEIENWGKQLRLHLARKAPSRALPASPNSS